MLPSIRTACPVSGHYKNNVIKHKNLDRKATFKPILLFQSSLASDSKNINRLGSTIIASGYSRFTKCKQNISPRQVRDKIFHEELSKVTLHK